MEVPVISTDTVGAGEWGGTESEWNMVRCLRGFGEGKGKGNRRVGPGTLSSPCLRLVVGWGEGRFGVMCCTTRRDGDGDV